MSFSVIFTSKDDKKFLGIFSLVTQKPWVQEVQIVLSVSISNLLDIFFRVLERREDVMADLRVLSPQSSGNRIFFCLVLGFRLVLRGHGQLFEDFFDIFSISFVWLLQCYLVIVLLGRRRWPTKRIRPGVSLKSYFVVFAIFFVYEHCTPTSQVFLGRSESRRDEWMRGTITLDETCAVVPLIGYRYGSYPTPRPLTQPEWPPFLPLPV